VGVRGFETGSYLDQKLLDAFYDVDCSEWYLFNTGIPCPAAY
jgi:hypothetical protein